MSVQGAIVNRLENYAGVSALVSDRIYPIVIPQNTTYPAIHYDDFSPVYYSAMGADATITATRFRVTAIDDSYSGAKALEVQILAALKRWSGTADGTTIVDVFHEVSNNIYDDDLGTYQTHIDFMVHYYG